MKIIDFHLHVNPKADVNKEKNISLQSDIRALFKGLSCKLTENKIEKGLAIVLDQSFLEKDLLNKLEGFENLLFSFMIDFRKPNAAVLLNKACSLKSFTALKFHPTHQNIQREDFAKAKELAQKASAFKKIIILDCHSVKSDSLEVEFVKYLLPTIKTPLILAHAGGLKALEALVVALDFPNVYLETSFSVPFWQGSSLENDLAFSFKKIGASRCLYGSDSPYIPLEESLQKTLSFFKKYKFSTKEIEQIMSQTALHLLTN
ncbi:amidohydrolase [Candidatus Parcubacteria bacterium]|nr:amidohydrolase [Candidatus Parcubacteria bacterium]